MPNKSRTAQSILNSIVALTMYFVNLVLQFYSRKIFLEYLGAEILGLNSTAYNLLQFLNLAELGIGSAIGYTLYKPIYENDRETIINIVSLQGRFYKKIACIIIFGAVILSFFFPVIFKKMELPLWYAYASFGVLLFSSLLGYFVNYKQILLTASMQEYKIQYSYRLIMIVKTLCQMIAMCCFSHPYLWWLGLEVAFTIIGSCSLNVVIRKSFPYLKSSALSFRQLRRQYGDVITKVKQVFVHNTSAFALLQFSPLMIYFYTSLSDVTKYGNYILIITGITRLLKAAFDSVVAGIGNLLSQHPDRAYPFFSELFSLRFFVASISCFLFYNLADSFITIWIGSEFLMPNSTLILLSITVFITLFRQVIDNFISAYGLFSDIWAPISEIILNVLFSVILGKYWGINGIISGMIISQTLIILIWKPYFLFSRGIKRSVRSYWALFFKHLILSIIVAGLCLIFIGRIKISVSGYMGLSLACLIDFFSFGLLLLIAMNLTNCGIKHFEYRVVNLIRKHIGKTEK